MRNKHSYSHKANAGILGISKTYVYYQIFSVSLQGEKKKTFD